MKTISSTKESGGPPSSPANEHVSPQKKQRMVRPSAKTRARRGLRAIESYLPGPLNWDRLPFNLSAEARESLDLISSATTYPKGALLLVEGRQPHGVFILRHGRVKLISSCADGKSVTLGVAEPGDIVGLPGTLSGNPCEATAEALKPLLADFIPRKAFLQFLRDNPEAAVKAAEIASHLYQSTCRTVRYLVFCCSAEQKLACFLLHWAADRRQNGSQNPAAITLTHKEIAERIGASRETITRLFASFKRKQLLQGHGSAVVISGEAGLKKIVPSI